MVVEYWTFLFEIFIMISWSFVTHYNSKLLTNLFLLAIVFVSFEKFLYQKWQISLTHHHCPAKLIKMFVWSVLKCFQHWFCILGMSFCALELKYIFSMIRVFFIVMCYFLTLVDWLSLRKMGKVCDWRPVKNGNLEANVEKSGEKNQESLFSLTRLNI